MQGPMMSTLQQLFLFLLQHTSTVNKNILKLEISLMGDLLAMLGRHFESLSPEPGFLDLIWITTKI